VYPLESPSAGITLDHMGLMVKAAVAGIALRTSFSRRHGKRSQLVEVLTERTRPFSGHRL
jgi:hypothetical protein